MTCRTARKFTIMKKFFPLLFLLLASLASGPRAQAQTGQQVTFSQHIAPLVFQHCTSCHRVGEVAPFPLTTYAEVASHGQTIKYVTGTRYMPPWKGDPTYRHYLDENTLTTTEIQQLKDWVDNGMPQGNPALTPPVPTFPSGSQLGTPDLVIPMAQAFTHQGNGQDLYRVFVLPVNIPANRDIAAIEFRAGNKRIVHHAIIGLDTTQQAQALDAADPGYGYTQFGGFGFNPVEAMWSGWVSGTQARFFPAGMGKQRHRPEGLFGRQYFLRPAARYPLRANRARDFARHAQQRSVRDSGRAGQNLPCPVHCAYRCHAAERSAARALH